MGDVVTMGLLDVLASVERIEALADRARALGADEAAAALDAVAWRRLAFAAGMVGGLGTIASRLVGRSSPGFRP